MTTGASDLHSLEEVWRWVARQLQWPPPVDHVAPDPTNEQRSVAMKIVVPLQDHGPVVVGVITELPGMIGLSVVLEPDEIVVPEEPASAPPVPSTYEGMVALVERLTDRLEAVQHLQSIDRDLTPDEARAVAAVLRHGADEAERRQR